MKKILKIILSLCLIVITTIGFAGCGETIKITFETQDGSLYFETTGSSNNVIEVPSGQDLLKLDLPFATKQGYNFIGWYQDQDFYSGLTETKIENPNATIERTGDTTLYAKYQVDTEFFNEGITFDWNAETSYISTAKQLSSSTYIFLLNKTNTENKLGKIVFTDNNGQGFICDGLKVYDSYGRLIPDGNLFENTWEPTTQMSASETGFYVITVSVKYGGEAQIMIGSSSI